jgi:predicted amidohydrolase YtcJ
MLHPYSEPRADSPCGRRMMTDEEFVAALEQAASANVPIVAHAIGDAAVRWCLDLIAARGRRDLAHRIEHCEFVDESDVPRFAAFGVIASVQPCHLLADVEALRRFTPHRLHRVLPLRELYDAAASSGRNPADAIWFGSDAPVVAPEPRDNIQAAAERRRMGAPRSEAIAPEQAITIEELGALQQSFVPG